MTLTTILILAYAFVGVACFVAGYYAGQNAVQKELKPLHDVIDDIHSGVEALREWNMGRTP
jgi:hypothetical protein